MKQLTALKIINWHKISNETIIFPGNILLTGQNGSGKSTIIDAMNTVICCEPKNFNLAANKNDKRTLASYVRCYLEGTNHHSALRNTGRVVTHVALEIKNLDNSLSVVGMTVVSESNNPNIRLEPKWYYCENCSLSDINFIENNFVTDYHSLTAKGVPIKMLRTQNDAKRVFAKAYGFSGTVDQSNVELFNRFIKIYRYIVSADANEFKNVNEIIKNLVLPARPINIQELKKNYDEAEKIQHEINIYKRKLNELYQIKTLHDDIENDLEAKRNYENVHIITKQLFNENNISKKKHSISKYTADKVELENQRSDIVNKIELLQERKEELISKGQDSIIESFKREISNIENEINEYKRKKEKIDKDLNAFKLLCSAINNSGLDKINNVLNDFYSLNSENIKKKKQEIFNLVSRIKNLRNFITEKKIKSNHVLSQINENILTCEKALRMLKSNQNPYTNKIKEIQKLLNEKLKLQGINDEVQILCEVMDFIEDSDSWTNAIEGFMGNKRFALFCSPENFLTVNNLYKDICKENNSYKNSGVEIIDMRQFAYDEVKAFDENMMLGHLTSPNINVKRYLQYAFGNVELVEDFSNMKKGSRAITKDCMRYVGCAASYINPNNYKHKYIGAKSKQSEIEKYTEELVSLKADKNDINSVISKYEDVLQYFEDRDLSHAIDSFCSNYSDYIDLISKNAKNNNELSKIKKDLEKREKDLGIVSLAVEKAKIEEQIKKENEEKDDVLNKISKIEVKIERLEDEVAELEEDNQEYKDKVALLEKENYDLYAIATDLYKNEFSSITNVEVIENKIKDKIQKLSDNITKNDSALIVKEQFFAECYDVSFGTMGNVNAEEYINFYNKIKNDDLIKLNEDLIELNKTLKNNFHENIISKMKDNFTMMKNLIRQQNRALKYSNLKDGTKYEFVYEKTSDLDKRDIYEMVNNYEFNSVEELDEDKKQILDNLIRNLVNAGDIDELNEFADYRNYFTFDVKFKTDEGEKRLSATNKCSSGGEINTPFYIVMAAALNNIYSSYNPEDCIRLFIADEAFTKMDEAKTLAVMQVLENFNFQTIFSSYFSSNAVSVLGRKADGIVAVFNNPDCRYTQTFSYKELVDEVEKEERKNIA